MTRIPRSALSIPALAQSPLRSGLKRAKQLLEELLLPQGREPAFIGASLTTPNRNLPNLTPIRPAGGVNTGVSGCPRILPNLPDETYDGFQASQAASASPKRYGVKGPLSQPRRLGAGKAKSATPGYASSLLPTHTMIMGDTTMKRMTVSLAAALLALSAGATSAQYKEQGPTEGPPAATVEFTGGSVGLGIGYTWIHGILHFKGMDYPFTANGLDLANVGASSVKGSANVYELTKIEDFPGIYTGIGAGATVAGGGAVVALQNQKNVVMQVSAMTQGLQLAIAASGVSVALNGPPVAGAVGSSTPPR